MFLVVKAIERAYIITSTFGRTIVAVSPSLIARRAFRPNQTSMNTLQGQPLLALGRTALTSTKGRPDDYGHSEIL